MNKIFTVLAFLLMLGYTDGMAQRVETVTATYTYVVTDDSDVSLKEARRRCIEGAKAKAIESVFGKMVTSDVIDSSVETNGESTSSYFWQNTMTSVRGDWIQDTDPPVLNIEYSDGKLIFTATVNGLAREIVQANVDIKWNILRDGTNRKVVTDAFESGERIYVNFRTPADGYVAVYLIVADDEVYCLLPYPNDSDGKFPVKSGEDYSVFDRNIDADARYYKMTTKSPTESNQIVLIYSPNPFVKCNDKRVDSKRPNVISSRNFQKWLLENQKRDRDMYVDKKWVKINNRNTENE